MMKKTLLAAALAVSATSAQAVPTYFYNLVFIGANLHSEHGATIWDGHNSGWIEFAIGQPPNPGASLTSTVNGNTLSIEWTGAEPGYSQIIHADLVFDHDLGGALPTDNAGFLATQSLLYTDSFLPGVLHDHLEGNFAWLGPVVVKDVPYGSLRGGNPNYAFALGDDPKLPEPASWALMITGFGLVGAAMRRRPQPALACRSGQPAA
jgi:hypothetical protein